MAPLLLGPPQGSLEWVSERWGFYALGGHLVPILPAPHPHWLLEFFQVVHENGGGGERLGKNFGEVTKWDPIFESAGE